MGCYINPPHTTKELWLALHGEQVSLSECQVRFIQNATDDLPVCLVDNGGFTAAGVAFDQSELTAFSDLDGRPKQWYMVPRKDLYEVSDLKGYEQNGSR